MTVRKLSRREFLTVTATGIAGLGIAACAPTAPAPATNPTTAVVATKAPVAGAKSKFTSSANFQPPEALHGNPIAPPGIDASVRFVYDPLFDYVPIPKDNYIPMLGETYTETGNTITIKLRKGVLWHDGKPFTSKDVVSTYNLYFINNDVVWRYIEKLEAPDDFTVVFTWKKPSPVLKPMLFAININCPYHVYGKWADQVPPLLAKRNAAGDLDEAANKERNVIREDFFAFKPKVTENLGTGPFKITGVTTSDMNLEKVETSWCAKNVKFDQLVIMRYIAQDAYVTNAMSGKYDGEQHGMPPDVFEQLKKAQPDMKVMWSWSGSQPGFEFNMLKPPLDNPLVRKAIVCALDIKSAQPIFEPGTFDPDTKVTGLVPTFRDRWVSKAVLDKLVDYSYNKAKAEDYLKQAGWKKGADGFYVDAKGTPVTLEISSMNSWPIFFLGGDAFVQQLNAFGLKSTFKPMDLAAYWDYINNGQHMIGMDFRGNIGAYGHPWGAYKNLFRDNPTRLGFVDAKAAAGTNFEVKVKIPSGEVVDALALTDQLFNTTDVKEASAICDKLAQAVNELVPFAAMGEKAEPIKIYAPGKKIIDFPAEDEPYWFQGLNSYARLMKIGKLAPKVS